MSNRRVIAVDLDGTLAHYDRAVHAGGFRADHVGDPVPAMLSRVKRWLSEGIGVVVYTARAAPRDDGSHWTAIYAIHGWCHRHLGVTLDVTHEKRPEFSEFWDDRAVAVEPNTGLVIGASRALLSPDPVQTSLDYLAGERSRVDPTEFEG